MRPACLLTRSSLQTQRMETKQLLPRSDAFMDLLVTSHALMANGIRQWKCNRGKKWAHPSVFDGSFQKSLDFRATALKLVAAIWNSVSVSRHHMSPKQFGNLLYRVSHQVSDLGWGDFDFGYRTVCHFCLGWWELGRMGEAAGQDEWNIEIKVNPTLSETWWPTLYFLSDSPYPRSVAWPASPQCWSCARRTRRRWWGRARAETACLWTAAGDMTCPRLKERVDFWFYDYGINFVSLCIIMRCFRLYIKIHCARAWIAQLRTLIQCRPHSVYMHFNPDVK